MKNGRNFLYRTDNHVPLVVPGVSSAVRHRDRPDAHHRTQQEEVRCMTSSTWSIEWLKDFTENLADESADARRDRRAGIFGTSPSCSCSFTKKRFEEASCVHTLPQGPELPSMQTDQIYQGSLQKALRTPPASRRKLRRPDHG